MPESYQIRELRRSDFAQYRPLLMLAVGQLERSTGLDAVAEATVDQLSRRSVWFIMGLLRLVGRPVVDILVATEGDTLAGTGTILWLPGPTAYVAGMSTKPEARGHGIASRILAEAADRSQRRRREWIALDVESENATALRVYRKAGYQDLGTYAWFSRTGLPPVDPTRTTSPSPAGERELEALASRLDADRPADYRAAFPANPTILDHNEIMVRGARLRYLTWIRPTLGGGVAALRAYHLPGLRTGVYFPMSTLPEPGAEEFTGLIDAATGWLHPLGVARAIAAAREPSTGIAAALERKGFGRVVASKVMIRRTSDRAAPTGASAT